MLKILYIALIVFLSGCQFGLTPEVGDSQPITIITSTPNMILGDISTISARAVAPVWRDDVSLSDGEVSNYPAVGQITTWEVDGTILTSTTTYPYTDNIIRTVESYEIDADGYAVSKERYDFFTEFSNGEIRNEIIELEWNTGVLPEDFPEDIVFGFGIDTERRDQHFISKVTYIQRNPDIEEVASNARLNGTRWYINFLDNEQREYIREEGFIMNPDIPGFARGRAEIVGEFFVVYDENSNITLTGSYVIRDRNGTEFKIEYN